jgi:probable HAF family extracellular repeat protein
MNRMKFFIWVVTALILVPMAEAQSYTLTDLGTLGGGTYSYATAINDHGEVAGIAYLSGGVYAVSHAFLWTAAGGMQDLGTLPGDNYSYAQGINNSGVVVGTSFSSDSGVVHAFLWTRRVGMQNLGTLGGNSYANGINDSGQVVGYSYLSDDASAHGFLWTKTGGMQDLGTLGGSDSTATAINKSGEVVGYSSPPGDLAISVAFVWTQAGGMQDLGTLGGTQSFANAVSSSGMVLGYSYLTSNKRYQAFFWTQNHGMQPLPTDTDSIALSVNASNEVVGAIVEPQYGDRYAFLWTPTQHQQNLGLLIPPGSGWELSTADGINQSGQIAATGTINGETHAALLTPVN